MLVDARRARFPPAQFSIPLMIDKPVLLLRGPERPATRSTSSNLLARRSWWLEQHSTSNTTTRCGRPSASGRASGLAGSTWSTSPTRERADRADGLASKMDQQLYFVTSWVRNWPRDPSNASNVYRPTTRVLHAAYAGAVRIFPGYATSIPHPGELARVQLPIPAVHAAGWQMRVSHCWRGRGKAGVTRRIRASECGTAYLYTPPRLRPSLALCRTAELRLPVAKMLTFDLSGRYDDYRSPASSFEESTYNIGLEFRPIPSTALPRPLWHAFKVPTLADEFQAQSGFLPDRDRLLRRQAGYAGPTYRPARRQTSQFSARRRAIHRCSPSRPRFVTSVSCVRRSPQSAFTIDFIHWKITDEVAQQDSDQLLDRVSLPGGNTRHTSPTCNLRLPSDPRLHRNHRRSIRRNQNVAQEP